jgi:uncharacterized protein (TIGR02172 family)
MEKMELLGHGRMADVYVWEDDKILKLNQAQYPRIVAEQEFAASKAAQAAGLPVPAVYEIIELDGRFGIIFERISGRSLLDELQSNPWKLFSIARQLAELHAFIHSREITGAIQTQKARIENGIQAAQAITEDEKNSIRRNMAGLPEGNKLCHGDFHPGNILLSPKGPMIIDWLTGSRGDPLSDVCRTVMIFETVTLPSDMPLVTRIIQQVSRSLLTSIYLQHYLKIRGVKKEEITRWRLPLLAARLREVESYPREKKLILNQIHALLHSIP